MTPDQIQHREQIILDYSNSYRAIYDAGAIEHGGLMTDLPVKKLAEEALNEFQDGYAYVHTLLHNADKVRIRLQQLKDILAEDYIDHYGWVFDADEKIIDENDDEFSDPTPISYLWTIDLIDYAYDPIRRIEAIERILYGEG